MDGLSPNFGLLSTWTDGRVDGPQTAFSGLLPWRPAPDYKYNVVTDIALTVSMLRFCFIVQIVQQRYNIYLIDLRQL